MKMPSVHPNTVAVGQGAFYVASGLWPVFNIRSFEKVPGPKADRWLVKTVGLLIATTGAVLLCSGIRREKVPKEIPTIGAGQAAVLGGVSLVYSSLRRISKIYLFDTVVESALLAAWAQAVKQHQYTAKSTRTTKG